MSFWEVFGTVMFYLTAGVGVFALAALGFAAFLEDRGGD